MAQYFETCNRIKRPDGRQDSPRIVGYEETMVTLSVPWYKISPIANRYSVSPKGKEHSCFCLLTPIVAFETFCLPVTTLLPHRQGFHCVDLNIISRFIKRDELVKSRIHHVLVLDFMF